MKKLFVLFMLTLSIMGLASCNNDNLNTDIPSEGYDDKFTSSYEDPYKDKLRLNMSFDEEKGNTVRNLVTGIDSTIEYIFTNAKYQKPRDPKRITKSAPSGNALSFDGYSNSIEINDVDGLSDSELTIDLFVAPRVFEWDDPNAHKNGTEKIQAIISTLDINQKSGFEVGMYKYGDFVFRLGLGDRIITLWNEWNELDKYEWNHLSCTWNGATGYMAIYKNGELINFIEDAYGSLKHTNSTIYVAKSYQPERIGDFELHMFNGCMDELKIYNKELSDSDVLALHESYYKDGAIKKALFSEVWLDEEILKDDIYHPAFHATPPQHWMNEPHALFKYKGNYHLFYQFNLAGPYWRQICWGHWVSSDMVNWRNVKEAIVMDAETAVKDGAWSGGVSYRADGTPVLFITAGDDARSLNGYSNQNICLAVPKDLDDPDLTEWEVGRDLVAKLDSSMGASNQFRDPNIYYEDGTYYMVVGSAKKNFQGTAQVFTTKDDSFKHWDYKGHIFEPSYYEPYMGMCWELTNLCKLYNKDKTKSKYLFAFSPAMGQADNDVFYYLGDFDKKTCKFIPEFDIPKRMDFGNNVFTGPTISTMPDDGRVLICSILQDQRTGRDHYDSGWAFMAGIPRELSLDDDGNLKVTPIKELDNIKGDELLNKKNITISDLNKELNKINEAQIYLKLNVKSINANKLSLRLKDTGVNYSSLNYSFNNQYVEIDTRLTGDNNRVKGVFGDIVGGINHNRLDIEMFIDKGVVEIYINGHNTISAMIYDISPKMLLEADGSIQIENIQIKKMNSIR